MHSENDAGVEHDVKKEFAARSPSATQYLLTRLKKYTEYNVSVQPYYKHIEGASKVVRVRTMEDGEGYLRLFVGLLNYLLVNIRNPTKIDRHVICSSMHNAYCGLW